MNYVIQRPEIPALPVRSVDGWFPVHRIYCVGRNYAAHAREMGHDPAREPPFFFQKNPDNIVPGGGAFPYPEKTADVQHEIELVVALGSGGVDLSADQALACVYGYAVGLDMTRRDLQADLKKLGRPWEVGKAFEYSAPCSEVVRAVECGHPARGSIWLTVNGSLRQQGDLDQMIWNVSETIAYLSGYFTLAPGDLIFTGTPAGVAAVERGDVLRGGVDGVAEIEVTVV